MKNRISRSIPFIFTLALVVATIILAWDKVKSSDDAAAPTTYPQWQVVPPESGSTGSTQLVPLNSSECQIALPNGSHVTIPTACTVVANCPLTVAEILRSECATLQLDETQVAIGNAALQAENRQTGSGTEPPAETEIQPVDCPSVGYFVHSIRRGDTLWDLSRLYKLSLDDLLTLNNLNEWSAEHLHIGFPLCVPVVQ